MKSAIQVILLTLWICALAVPSVVTVLNSGEKPVMVMNLNEEEQQESISWDAEKKDLLRQSLFSIYLLQLENAAIVPASHKAISDPLFEISLPPPEQSSSLPA
jgi:hypothetical protein